MTSRGCFGVVVTLLLAGCSGEAGVDGFGGAAGAGTAGTGGSAGGAGGGGSGGGAGGGGAGQGGGAGSGGSPIQQPECQSDADCHLVNTCCDCAGFPAGPDPDCPLDCDAPACTAHEPPAVESQCRLGRCVTTVDCNLGTITCEQAEPSCPAGETPTHDGNGCYGPCHPAVECQSVGRCGQCGPGEACVAEVAQLGPVYHCVAPLPECSGPPSCDCLGPTVCLGAFNQCVENNGTLECHCPTC